MELRHLAVVSVEVQAGRWADCRAVQRGSEAWMGEDKGVPLVQGSPERSRRGAC